MRTYRYKLKMNKFSVQNIVVINKIQKNIENSVCTPTYSITECFSRYIFFKRLIKPIDN